MSDEKQLSWAARVCHFLQDYCRRPSSGYDQSMFDRAQGLIRTAEAIEARQLRTDLNTMREAMEAHAQRADAAESECERLRAVVAARDLDLAAMRTAFNNACESLADVNEDLAASREQTAAVERERDGAIVRSLDRLAARVAAERERDEAKGWEEKWRSAATKEAGDRLGADRRAGEGGAMNCFVCEEPCDDTATATTHDGSTVPICLKCVGAVMATYETTVTAQRTTELPENPGGCAENVGISAPSAPTIPTSEGKP